MKFTASSCATEVLDERIDKYDGIVGKDPAVKAARERIANMLAHLQQSMIKCKAPAEDIRMISDLEDEITMLECEDIRAIAADGLNDVSLACNLGLWCERIHHRLHPGEHNPAGRRPRPGAS